MSLKVGQCYVSKDKTDSPVRKVLYVGEKQVVYESYRRGERFELAVTIFYFLFSSKLIETPE